MSAKFRRLAAWVPAVVAAVCCANAQAQFAARDLNADGVTDAYYDAANNISWLAMRASRAHTLKTPCRTPTGGKWRGLGEGNQTFRHS